MATYREFSDGPPGLRIEVEAPAGGPAGGATPSLAGLLGAIRTLVAQVAQHIGQLPAEQRPTDLTVAFGVRALESGDYAIGLDETAANFRVSLAWTQEPAPPAPEVPGPQVPGLP